VRPEELNRASLSWSILITYFQGGKWKEQVYLKIHWATISCQIWEDAKA